jgi:choline dehydrogenase-like flavoprotein
VALLGNDYYLHPWLSSESRQIKGQDGVGRDDHRAGKAGLNAFPEFVLVAIFEGLAAAIIRLRVGAFLMAQYNDGEISPGPGVETDEQILDWVGHDGETALHPSCTAKMGVDDMAVVDPQLRVRGVAGLRVVDASVMPTLIGGNTNAPTIMIGERASDLIRGTA